MFAMKETEVAWEDVFAFLHPFEPKSLWCNPLYCEGPTGETEEPTEEIVKPVPFTRTWNALIKWCSELWGNLADLIAKVLASLQIGSLNQKTVHDRTKTQDNLSSLNEALMKVQNLLEQYKDATVTHFTHIVSENVADFQNQISSLSNPSQAQIAQLGEDIARLAKGMQDVFTQVRHNRSSLTTQFKNQQNIPHSVNDTTHPVVSNVVSFKRR